MSQSNPSNLGTPQTPVPPAATLRVVPGCAMQIREMTIRYKLRGKAGERLSQPEQVAAAVRRVVGDDPREHFMVLHLDGRNHLIDVEVVHIGTLNQSLVHPREVFRSAIVRSDAAIVVAHQHPSGNPRPSLEDYEVTGRLVRGGEILGIRVLDHVVVGSSSCASIRELQPELFR